MYLRLLWFLTRIGLVSPARFEAIVRHHRDQWIAVEAALPHIQWEWVPITDRVVVLVGWVMVVWSFVPFSSILAFISCTFL